MISALKRLLFGERQKSPISMEFERLELELEIKDRVCRKLAEINRDKIIEVIGDNYQNNSLIVAEMIASELVDDSIRVELFYELGIGHTVNIRIKESL